MHYVNSDMGIPLLPLPTASRTQQACSEVARRSAASDGTPARSNPLEQREQPEHLCSSADRRKPDPSPRSGKSDRARNQSDDWLLPAERERRNEACHATCHRGDETP